MKSLARKYSRVVKNVMFSIAAVIFRLAKELHGYRHVILGLPPLSMQVINRFRDLLIFSQIYTSVCSLPLQLTVNEGHSSLKENCCGSGGCLALK